MTDLPRRLAASIGNTIDAAGELPVFQQQVLEHLGSMDQVMSEHLASMDEQTAALVDLIRPMGEDIARLNARVVAIERRIDALAQSLTTEVGGQLTEANATMMRVERSVKTISDRVPDPDAPGPIAKAREAITGE